MVSHRLPLRLLYRALIGLLIAAPSGCGSGDPELPAASALRLGFPEQASMVLEQTGSFVATEKGFTREAAEDEASTGRLQATLPRDSAEAIMMRAGSGSEVRVRELDLVGEGQPAENAVSYRRAGGTSFWTATAGGMEEWLHLDAGLARAGVTVAAWEISGATLRERGDAVDVLDAGGLQLLRVTAPSAYAAGGREVTARLSVQGARIELSVDADGEAVLVDPAWTPGGAMSISRRDHTATLLRNGKVLVVGGGTSTGGILSTAELYDPASNTWTTANRLHIPRTYHTATLLQNGKVLVAGGLTPTRSASESAITELYDPGSDTWTVVGSLLTPRYNHATTLLQNGKVLITGGWIVKDSGGPVTLMSTELFDPGSNTWSAAATLSVPRAYHSTTLLNDGKVLVAGGQIDDATYLATAELYDPGTDRWTGTGSLSVGRTMHTATLFVNGRVLVTGGFAGSGGVNTAAEIYNPVSKVWKAAGMISVTRTGHQAIALVSGRVLVVGGLTSGLISAKGELYNPVTNTWTTTAAMSTVRQYLTATLLGNGKVLAAGGQDGTGVVLASSELYDPTLWTPSGSLGIARSDHTATRLANDKVLVTGGITPVNTFLASSELYDPASGTWATVGSLSQARAYHTATRLQDGKVLVVGGFNPSSPTLFLQSADLFDPATNTWKPVAPPPVGISDHTATLLSNGKVLVVGGHAWTGYQLSVELYDPATNSWSLAAPLHTERARHTATVLKDGEVLVAGGFNGSYMKSVELYDPGTNTWSPMASLNTERYVHVAALLPSGQVLVAGGYNGTYLASVELYDPVDDTWTFAMPMSVGRHTPAGAQFVNGQVLVAGGVNSSGSYIASAEVYDPVGKLWTPAGSLGAARSRFTATLLDNGQVLAAGGVGTSGMLPSAELYNPNP